MPLSREAERQRDLGSIVQMTYNLIGGGDSELIGRVDEEIAKKIEEMAQGETSDQIMGALWATSARGLMEIGVPKETAEQFLVIAARHAEELQDEMEHLFSNRSVGGVSVSKILNPPR